MSKLSDLKDSMLIKVKPDSKYDCLCMGEVWHNQRMELLFSGVKYSKFNYELLLWVKEQITDYRDSSKKYGDYGEITMHSSNEITKGQIQKINAICKAKSKATLQKRILSLSGLFTSSMCQQIFNKGRNQSWHEFCKAHNLDSGLVKVNRYKEYEKTLNAMLQAM